MAESREGKSYTRRLGELNLTRAQIRGNMIQMFEVLRVLMGVGPDDIFKQTTVNGTRNTGANPWQNSFKLLCVKSFSGLEWFGPGAYYYQQ